MSISDVAKNISLPIKSIFRIFTLPLSIVKTFLYTLLALCISTSVYADNIEVTITEDVVAEDEECSFREAVDFLNNNIEDSTHECFPKDGNPARVIELNTDEVYELNTELKIHSNMTIKSSLADDFSNQDGKKISTIKITQGRAFLIDDKSTLKAPILVIIKGLEIQGKYNEVTTPKQNQITTNEGGLIYNREKLKLEKVRLLGGGAAKGGAVYNASIDSNLQILNSEIINNFAYQGSAIYSEHEAFVVTKSLFTNNNSLYGNSSANTANSFVIQTLKAYPKPLISNVASGKSYVIPRLGKVANSIFYKNLGNAVLNVLPGMEVNNLTVIANGAGILLQSGFNYQYASSKNRPKVIASYLANSIVLNNKNYDVRQTPNDLTFVNHLLLSNAEIFTAKQSSYQAYNTLISNIPTDRLITKLETQDDEGNTKTICGIPNMQETLGLFCPLIKQDDEFVANLKPRLLMTYNSIADSPIVNKGVDRTKVNNTDVLECETEDIRGQSRKICDLGAFELSINKEENISVKSVNAEVGHGEDARLSLKDVSGDGQLIPASQCGLYIANPPTDPNRWLSGKVNEWTDGCVTFLAGKHPKKGRLELSEFKDSLVYKASSNYHGTDEFTYQMVTTTSRFSEAQNDKQITAKTIVYQYPTNEFSNSKADLGYSEGSGSFTTTWLVLLASLFGLSAWVRKRYSNTDE